MKYVIMLLLISSLTIKAQIKQDAVDHFAAGYFIGAAVTGITWHYTGKKWHSFAIGVIASSAVGLIKEQIDEQTNRVASFRDARNTILGGLSGSFTITLIIGKSRKEKKCQTTKLRMQ